MLSFHILCSRSILYSSKYCLLTEGEIENTMIFGSVAYRGSFNLKSDEKTAGSFTLIVSRPPSTSLTTVASPSPLSILEANVAYREIDTLRHAVLLSATWINWSDQDRKNNKTLKNKLSEVILFYFTVSKKDSMKEVKFIFHKTMKKNNSGFKLNVTKQKCYNYTKLVV